MNLTYTQYIVMMTFWEFGSMTEGELGQKVRLDSGTLAPLLKRLEKAGYVTRERSKDDERVTVISITPEGTALKEKCKDIPIELSKKESPLTQKEVKELYRLLYKIVNSGQ